ncbi:MAG: low molecular weight phosphatase family protein [Thermoanaerobaculia bacterium]
MSGKPLAGEIAMTERSILFVCAGNTCRSVMAEAFARRRFGDSARIDSAGLRPQLAADAVNAIDTLRFEFGIDASAHQPKSAGSINVDEFSEVIAMDKAIARELRTRTGREITVWDVHDPWGDDPYEYKRCALKIKALVAKL